MVEEGSSVCAISIQVIHSCARTPLSTETTHCGRVLRQVKGSPTNLAIVILVGKVPCIATNHFDHQGNGFRQLGSHGVLAAQLASLGT